MRNLLKETIGVLTEYDLTLDDVISIQGDDFSMSIETFKRLADTFYNNGFGSPKVAQDLTIIGDGWWLDRAEYDGSEWWEFNQIPTIKPLSQSDIKALTVEQSKGDLIGWASLSELNNECD